MAIIEKSMIIFQFLCRKCVFKGLRLGLNKDFENKWSKSIKPAEYSAIKSKYRNLIIPKQFKPK